MIEIQREKMGLSPTTATTTPVQPPTTTAPEPIQNTVEETTKPAPQPQPQPEIKKITYHNEDEKLRKFLTRLKDVKSTVPPSLTRRILNKQGVGFEDPSVSTIVSCAADNFLATVLSQALACRDRRLKGEELLRKEQRELERVRKRRRAEQKSNARKKQRLEKDLTDMVKKIGKSNQKNDKKPSPELINLLQTKTFDEVGRKDSMDEEEDYYLKMSKDKIESEANADGEDEEEDDVYVEDDNDEDDEDDYDDDRDLLHMRDIARPLRVWGIDLAGKMGLAPEPKETIRKKKDKAMEENEDEEDELDDVDADEDEEEDPEKVAPAKKARAKSPVP